MRLTRRDALAALAGAGIVGGGALTAASRDSLDGDRGERPHISPSDVDTLVAAGEIVYPAEVSGIREFVETYTVGRVAEREDYRRGIRAATGVLDDAARTWYDRSFADLRPGLRDALLREIAAAADPDPDGAEAERVRFYVVNELLYALYTSPAGGRLVGLENPQGHPGGTESYRRGPDG